MELSVSGKRITLEPIDPIKALRGILKGMSQSPLEIKQHIRAEEDSYEKKHLRS